MNVLLGIGGYIASCTIAFIIVMIVSLILVRCGYFRRRMFTYDKEETMFEFAMISLLWPISFPALLLFGFGTGIVALGSKWVESIGERELSRKRKDEIDIDRFSNVG